MKQIVMVLLLSTLSLSAFAKHPHRRWHYQNVQIPSEVVIQSVEATGALCSAEKSAISISPDSQDASILFSERIIDAANPSEALKVFKSKRHQYLLDRCKITVVIDVPKGFRLKLKGLDVRGFEFVEKGDWRFRGYRSSLNGHYTNNTRLLAPGEINSDFIDSVTPMTTWSNCSGGQKTIEIDSVAELILPRSKSISNSQMTIDSLDLSLKNPDLASWQACEYK